MLGIIPCAGEGSRWGRFHKELLPIGPEVWLIDNCLESMKLAGVRKFCIITSANKVHTHTQHFLKEKYNNCDIFYVVQKEQSDIWGAIKESLPYAEEINLFAMPDTLFDKTAMQKRIHAGPLAAFNLGTFNTRQPERFGVLLEGRVINKARLPEASYSAWGAMIWNKAVVESWLRSDPRDYTRAINQAITEFGCETFDLNYYYDFSTWSDFKLWLAQSEETLNDESGVKESAAVSGQV